MYVFHGEGGPSVCGGQNLFGSLSGRAVFFNDSEGDQNFLGFQEGGNFFQDGGPDFLPLQRNYL